MKKYYIITILSALCLNIYSQQTDMRISELINNSEWFELADKYPALKKSLKDSNIALMAECMLASQFNKPEKTLDYIVTLVNERQQQIGSNNAYSLASMGVGIYESMGQYDTAAKKAEGILKNVKTGNPYMVWKDLDNIYKRTSQLSGIPAPQIQRPEKDVVLKYATYDEDGNNKYKDIIYLRVKIKGNDYMFVFDTGADNTYISKDIADRLGIKTLDAYNGFRMAHIDSIVIGDIIYKDPIALVFDPATQKTPAAQIDGIIGIDFMKRIGKVCIDVKAQELIFPINNTKTKSSDYNIRLDKGRTLFVESSDKSGNLNLSLSTGEPETYFLQSYYEKHFDKLVNNGKKVQNTNSNGQNSDYVLRVPQVSFRSVDHNITLANARIEEKENRPDIDGVLGMDFINRFNRVTLDFNDMSISMN